MKISEVTFDSLIEQILKSVEKAFTDTAFKHPGDEKIVDLCSTVADWIIEYAPDMEARNIDKAIQNGILGGYGEYMGLSVVTFKKFITGYNSQTRKPVHQEEDKQPPTPAEQFLTLGNMAIEERNSYAADKAGTGKKGFVFNPVRLAYIYDFLNSIGLISYGKEVKNEMWLQGKTNVVERYTARKNAGDAHQRQVITALIDRFQLGPDPETKEHAEMVAEGKALTVVKYFDDITLTKSNLTELIEGKREVFFKLKS